jgi:predicted O-methyltransferase YrrM
MLDDATFLRICRGEYNPGKDLADEDLRSRALDISDQASNLAFLYGITRGMGALRILEVGTSDGTSTLAFLKAACEVGGRVTSVDVDECLVAHALVDKYQMRPNWRFLRGDSREVLPYLADTGEKFDVALVDGLHTEDGCRADFAAVARMLPEDPGGVVFIHDSLMVASDHDFTKPRGQIGQRGCGLFVRELCSHPAYSVVLFPFGCSMSIVRRKSSCEGTIDRAVASAVEQGLLPAST